MTNGAADFAWTPHRFSGGLVIFDLCNTIILRHVPDGRKDRLADAATRSAFVPALRTHCAEADLARHTEAPFDVQRLFALREAADAHFRACVTGSASGDSLADLLETMLPVLRHSPIYSLENVSARSALRLLGVQDSARLKACPACGWLFFDRSKNRSRAWCDMTVCGNRAKAKRFYSAHRTTH
jgi:predicted RNA-binding Zn ribbon-like protein